MGIATPSSAIAVGFIFPPICGFLVALRFYVRRHLKVPWKIDDWLCIPAWLCLVGCCASLLTGVFKNAFVEQTVADSNSVTKQQQVLAQASGALVLFWIASNTLIKLSILFFYRRIFIGRIFNICNWTLIGLSFVWLVYAFLAWLLYCGTNIHANFEGGWADCDPWGFDIQMGTFCLDSLIDLCLIILPLPSIWKLHLSLLQKLIIAMIFMLGGLAFVAGLSNTIVQMVYLTQPSVAESGGNSGFFEGPALLIYMWPTIEIGVGLIVCNLPSLSFRAAHFLPKLIRHGWNSSLSGLRHAAEKLTLTSRSDPLDRSPTPSSDFRKISHDTASSDQTRVEDSNGNGGREWGHEVSEGASVSRVPLVHVRSDITIKRELRPMRSFGYGNGNGMDRISESEETMNQWKVPRGFDAV